MSNLFPFSGLQGIVSYPILIILGISTGILISKLFLLNLSLAIKGLCVLVAIFAMFLLQTITYPQDAGSSVVTKITNSLQALKMYDDLESSKFIEYNREQQIVYSVKFNKKKDEEYFTIWNSESRVKYHIIRQAGNIKFDRQRVILNTIKSPNEITEIDSNGNKVKHTIDNIETLFTIGSGSYKNWSIRKFRDEFVGYERILSNLIKRKEY